MKYRDAVIIAIVTALAAWKCLAGLATAPAERWDERTNMDVVTHSIAAGSLPFLTYGGRPFFEKPPVWYLTTASLVGVLGPTLTAFRLVSAVSGIIAVAVVTGLSMHWYGTWPGTAAAAVMLTTPQLYVPDAGGYFSTHTFRSADVDALQIAGMMLATALFSASRTVPAAGIAAAVTSAVCVLTKGPLGLLPITVHSAYGILHADGTAGRGRIAAWWAIIIGCVIPWYAAMTAVYGMPFLSAHFGYHLGNRLVTPLEGHDGRLWFSLSVLSSPAVFPWAILLYAAFCTGILRIRRLTYGEFIPLASAGLCLMATVIVRTKLAWYVLPVYPYAAISIAGMLARIPSLLTLRQRHG